MQILDLRRIPPNAQAESETQVAITCLDTETTRQADVLSRSLLELEVAVVGSNLPLRLSRRHPRKPFIGRCAGLEFSCHG